MHQASLLSVAIITLNEALFLPRCLASVATVADEIVVVDCGSTDGTVELARQHGATVLHHEWQGFSDQKQYAVDSCQFPWILLLDADEYLPSESAAAVRNTLANPRAKAYSFPRKNFFHNREIRHGSWGKDRVLRLFDRNSFSLSGQQVHEEVSGKGPMANLSCAIHHTPRKNLASFLDKANAYSSLGAEQMFQAGKKATLATAFAHALWNFFFNYFFRLGILDGGPGLLIAAADTADTFFKYAKLWELDQAGDQ
ncbi:MAG: glycosyltransferase family 2 protein [Deltaproteobacteria bacterium]